MQLTVSGRLGAIVLAAVIGTVAGACSTTALDSTTAGTTPSAGTRAPNSGQIGSDGTGSPQGASSPGLPGGDSSGRPAACTAEHLRITIGEPDAGAGQLYYPILFTNTGSAPCTLTGYPGVSLLNAAGTQIGAAATRSGQPVTTVTLPPSGQANALVHTSNQGGGYDNPTCRPASTYVRVYPPNIYTGVRVPYRLEVCTGPFEVRPVRAGTS